MNANDQVLAKGNALDKALEDTIRQYLKDCVASGVTQEEAEGFLQDVVEKALHA